VKFRSERDSLVDVLGVVGRAVTGRVGAVPVLSGVRMEVRGNRLLLAGSDLELTMEAEMDVAGLGDGVCVVPARTVTDIVRALEAGVVSVEADVEEVRITAGRYQSALRVLPADEFPRLPERGDERGAVGLEVADLAVALGQVVRAASADNARPILTGVLVAAEDDGLRLVATDSYRLAVRDLAGKSILAEGQSVLVPSKALSELQRLFSSSDQVKLWLREYDASFEVSGVRLTTRLIEGDFPNYRQLLPSSYPNRLTIDKEALLNATRRVRLLARDTTTPVRLTLRPDVIELAVVTSEIGHASEDVDAKYEGSEMTVAFNPGYLLDGVEAVQGEELTLETVDALRPAVIRGVGAEDYLYLLMPVRVS
jgi:DNA polymerase-3 subunit beta